LSGIIVSQRDRSVFFCYNKVALASKKYE